MTMLRKTRLKKILDVFDSETFDQFDIKVLNEDGDGYLYEIDGENFLRTLFRRFSQWCYVWDDTRPIWDTLSEPISDFTADFVQWSFNQSNNWTRILSAYLAEYNPIENYDKYEDHTRSSEWTKSGDNNDTTTTDSDVHSDVTVTTTDTTTATQYATTYDDMETDRKTGKVANGGTVTNRTATADDAGNVAANRSHGVASRDTTIDESGTDDITAENTHTHGNIGVTTAQQMIDAEMKLRHFNFLDYIVYDFAERYLMIAGGDDDDDYHI